MNNKTPHPFSSDSPIHKLTEDQLERRGFATSVAKAIANWKGSNESLIMALYGEWGNGKTSVKEMTKDALMQMANPRPYIVEFNPWEWSRHTTLSEVFFREIGAQIGNVEIIDGKVEEVKPDKVTKRIKDKALDLLDQFPHGLRYSELRAKIAASDPTFNSNTINGCIWQLDAIFPDQVYKPSKGLFRLLKHKPIDVASKESSTVQPPAAKIREEEFYAAFADWLTNEIQDVTLAIPLGRNKFKDKWGTPDVIGKLESRRSDIIKGPTEIVAAEIKTDSYQLITAFGQACAYKIFCHKVYLVVPSKSPPNHCH